MEAGYDLSKFPDLQNHPQVKDITGHRFVRLTVVAFGGSKEHAGGSRPVWICKCDCGTWRAVQGDRLKRGKTRSCGCLRRTYSERHSRMYRRWSGIIGRCTNPNDKDFKYYGGRGITICERWRNSFEAFQADVGQPPFPGAELDRIHNDQGYFPSNVRWSTRKAQMRNTRQNVVLEFDGERKCMADWADTKGLNSDTLRTRLLAGWSVERALTQPVRASRLTLLLVLFALTLSAQEPPACKIHLTFSMLTRDQSKALFNKAIVDALSAWTVAGTTDCPEEVTVNEEHVIAEMTKLGLNPHDRLTAFLVVENRDGQDGKRRIGRFLLESQDTIKDASLVGALLRDPSAQQYIPLAGWVFRIAGTALLGRTPDSLHNFVRLSEPHEMTISNKRYGAMRAWTRRWEDNKQITRHAEIVRK